jgi:predicted DNA-binding helix-hairpin-helix protein
MHPETFPLDVNRADRFELLRVPGLGPATVSRILHRRKHGGRVHSLADIGRPGKRLRKAATYLKF